MREGAVEVRHGLGQLAGVHQRQADVALEQGAAGGVATVAVQAQIEARRLLEVGQCLARRGGARGLLAGGEEIRLGLVEALGAPVVVGEHAVEVAQAVGEHGLDRRRDPRVQLAPLLRRQRGVDGLLHQRVLEDVLGLGGERHPCVRGRAAGPAGEQEAALGERPQALVEPVVGAQHRGQDAAEEGAADHRRDVEHAAAGGIEARDAGRDQLAHVSGNGEGVEVADLHHPAVALRQRTVVEQRSHHLLDEQRAAFRPLGDARQHRRRQRGGAEQVAGQLDTLLRVERCQREDPLLQRILAARHGEEVLPGLGVLGSQGEDEQDGPLGHQPQ